MNLSHILVGHDGIKLSFINISKIYLWLISFIYWQITSGQRYDWIFFISLRTEFPV